MARLLISKSKWKIMRRLTLLFVAILSFAGLQAQLADFFKDTDAFMRAHVKDGLVKYDAISGQPAQLNSLVEFIADLPATKLESASASERKAFYINAYNLLVIKSVIAKPGLSSPLDVEGFFDAQKHSVAGTALTLNELEKVRLIKEFGDPRIHFVLVCAAKGCPPILAGAYFPDRLESQLQERTVATLNSPQFIKLSSLDETFSISELFKWYYQDFGARTETDARGFTAFINKYRSEPLPSDHSMDFYPYDWSLNKTK